MAENYSMKGAPDMRTRITLAILPNILFLSIFLVPRADAQSERRLTIGISYRQVTENLDQFISMSKSTDVDGQTRYIGQTSDSLASLEIIGNKFDVTQTTLMIRSPKGAAEIVSRNAAILLRFVRNTTPEWRESSDWVTSALRRVGSAGKPEQITRGNKSIEVSLIDNLDMVSVTVKHKNAIVQQPSVAARSNELQPRLQGGTLSDNVTYSIINESTQPGVKRTLVVRLNRKASERTLRGLALELKSLDSQQYDRTFIMHYLPGMEVGAGAWATTHFRPELEVRIQGLTMKEEEKLVAEPAPAAREIIGRWLDEGPFIASHITIFRDSGKLFIEQIFRDGSSLKKDLVEVKSTLGRRFDPKKFSSTSGHVRQPDSTRPVSPSQSARPFSRNSESPQSSAARQFLRSKLAELDSFKYDSRFRSFGFGTAGPFNSWMKSLEAKRKAPGFSYLERVAAGDLQMLGLEYLKTKGRDNEYTRFARQQITQAMQKDGKVEDSNTGDHWVIGSDGNLQIRDKDGLIATAKKVG